jgi:hypothetical protein
MADDFKTVSVAAGQCLALKPALPLGLVFVAITVGVVAGGATVACRLVCQVPVFFRKPRSNQDQNDNDNENGQKCAHHVKRRSWFPRV